MKILVPTKRVPSTDEAVRIRPDGSGIEDAGLAYMINPFDAIALEEALHIREQRGSDVEVIAVGIGNADFESELRTALAMGADRALRVDFDGSLDPWSVAQVLAAVVRREKPNLVLMGKQAVDDDANQAGQMLAGVLDWPQATFASKIEFVEPARLSVARETDRGLETILIQLPAVITTDLRPERAALCFAARPDESEEAANRNDFMPGSRRIARTKGAACAPRTSHHRSDMRARRRRGRTCAQASIRGESNLSAGRALLRRTMTILVVAEHDGTKVRSGVYSALTVARDLAKNSGDNVELLVLGSGLDSVAADAARFAHVSSLTIRC